MNTATAHRGQWVNGNRCFSSVDTRVINAARGLDNLRYAHNFVVFFAHDDVIKWKHFPRYWPFVRGIHRSPVDSPHKGQWRGALMFSLICTRINGWVNNREAGDLRRHSAHCGVRVMLWLHYKFLMVVCVLPYSSGLLHCHGIQSYDSTMMTSSNENFFRVTALCEGNPPVTGGFPSQRPVTRNFDIFFDLHLNKQCSKQSRHLWIETHVRSLWRHCNDSASEVTLKDIGKLNG